MKTLQTVCLALLLSTFSSAYAGDCFKDRDVADCRVRAEQGDVGAQNNLGMMYNFGLGVVQDYKEAVKWYRLAAEQGDAQAQTNLGMMYNFGEGVAQDDVMAHMYWNIAGVSGNENKDARLNRGAVEKKMTPSQIEKAQKLAREWMKKHLPLMIKYLN
jgi:TPR repeat protein